MEPHIKKKVKEFRPVRFVIVRCVEVEYHTNYINIVLGKPLNSILPYEGFLVVASLDGLKKWLAPLISDEPRAGTG